MPQKSPQYISVILFLAVLALTGCTKKQADDPISEERSNALTWLYQARESDEAGQMRQAEFCYRKAYEMLKDNPSQDWLSYADAGYRYACMLNQRGDTEGALSVVNDMLEKQKLSMPPYLTAASPCQGTSWMPSAI